VRDTYPAVPVGSALTDDALRRAIDAAPDGVIVVDEGGTMVFVNPMVETLFEYGHDDLVGMSIDELLPEQMRRAHTTHRAHYMISPRARVMGSGYELRGRKRSGAEFPVEISLSPLQGRGRVLVIAIVRDVTDRRDADGALERIRAQLALVDERDRIARDLHDNVIQHLFAVGLSLQAVLGRVEAGPTEERIKQAVDELDGTITEIRSTIFALQARRPGGASLRDEVISVAHDAARALGFEPVIVFDGPIDSAAADNTREQLVSTLREALANVAKHAHATRVIIDVAIRQNDFVLSVTDDGVGMARADRAGSGLANMRARAEGLHGGCEVGSPSLGGTNVIWRVPVVEV
jgi:PAS domain S-box-containing protein